MGRFLSSEVECHAIRPRECGFVRPGRCHVAGEQASQAPSLDELLVKEGCDVEIGVQRPQSFIAGRTEYGAPKVTGGRRKNQRYLSMDRWSGRE